MASDGLDAKDGCLTSQVPADGATRFVRARPVALPRARQYTHSRAPQAARAATTMLLSIVLLSLAGSHAIRPHTLGGYSYDAEVGSASSTGGAIDVNETDNTTAPCASWCNPNHEVDHCVERECATCDFCTDSVDPCAGWCRPTARYGAEHCAWAQCQGCALCPPASPPSPPASPPAPPKPPPPPIEGTYPPPVSPPPPETPPIPIPN